MSRAAFPPRSLGAPSSRLIARQENSAAALREPVLAARGGPSCCWLRRHNGPVQRVSVVGNSGSGKTTLGAALGRAMGVPHLELDSVFHQPDWEPLDRDEFRRRVGEFVAADRWVVDGNYSSVRDLIWARADTVVWLDLPRHRVMRQILWRTIRRVALRKELWNGNRERLGQPVHRRPARVDRRLGLDPAPRLPAALPGGQPRPGQRAPEFRPGAVPPRADGPAPARPGAVVTRLSRAATCAGRGSGGPSRGTSCGSGCRRGRRRSGR